MGFLLVALTTQGVAHVSFKQNLRDYGTFKDLTYERGLGHSSMPAIPDSTLSGHKQLHERVVAALSQCRESQDVEFKRSSTWNDLRDHVARTMMAMSNLRDGGILIVGVREDDDRWVLEGIADPHLKTFDEDVVNDYVNKFATPSVCVELVRVAHDGKTYLSIRAPEFDSSPVVCKRDNAGLTKGRLYIRPIGKPETRPVADAAELQDLLDLAVEKRARRFLQMASRVEMKMPADVADDYDTELEDL